MKKQSPIYSKLENFKNLHSPPQILLKLLEVCSQEEINIGELSRIIEKDPSLSSKVLRMINSTYFNLPNKVENIEQTIVLLGLKTVKNVIFSASVCQTFSQVKGNSIFNLKFFWWHSLMCSTLAKLIAQKISYSSSDEAFLCGLLHDIGKMVLWVNFPKEYEDILSCHSHQPDSSLTEIEEKRLGTTHSQVGKWLMDRWNMQPFMEDAILYHHEPMDQIIDAFPLVKIVYGANILCSKAAVNKDFKYKVAEEVFGFSRNEVEEIISKAEAEVKYIAQSFDMEVEEPEELNRPFLEKYREKEMELVREVRDISLLQGTLRNLLEAHDQDSLRMVIFQGIQVLFDIKDVLLFLYDEDYKLLKASIFSRMESGQGDELVIPIQKEKSLAAKSLHLRAPLNSFDYLSKAEFTIFDKQIIRLLGKDGILCLPMRAHEQIVGVMALGMSKAHFFHIASRMKLLTVFANQAGLALYVENLRQNQEKLVQSERLAASLAIAHKISHEVNNPLSIIKNYLKILEINLEKKNIVSNELAIILEEIDRVSHLISELSNYSHIKHIKTVPLDVNAVLNDIVKITGESLKMSRNIHVHLDLEPSLPKITANKNSLKQVFINLFKNSIEAIGLGGNIYIKTQRSSRNPQDRFDEDMKETLDEVVIEIRDTGPGIPDAIKSKLFEPFVSSKKEGHGGLGLSIVYNIIKEFNGSISFQSNSKTGTIFRVIFPIRP